MSSTNCNRVFTIFLDHIFDLGLLSCADICHINKFSSILRQFGMFPSQMTTIPAFGQPQTP